jgi:predicted O-methyltransferase YrrM
VNTARKDCERLSSTVDTLAVHAERYERYQGDLRRARTAQLKRSQTRPAMRTQLDDVEAELVYLRVRAAEPAVVVEFGGRDGWSSGWLLRALRDNGSGELFSFAQGGDPWEGVPRELGEGRWHVVGGDPRRSMALAPGRIDYAHFDATAWPGLTHWFLDEVAAGLKPGTPVSVHDVFHHRFELPVGGAAMARRWLRRKRIECFTASPAKAPVVHRQLERIRCGLGFSEVLNPRGGANPTAFFRA